MLDGAGLVATLDDEIGFGKTLIDIAVTHFAAGIGLIVFVIVDEIVGSPMFEDRSIWLERFLHVKHSR